jgi:MFS family permease
MATAIAVYVPAAKIADRVGRKPFVVATFIAFAIFPLGVALSGGFASLAAAFVVGGLREIGEPARKAMIVDSASSVARARSVGLYYLVRCLAVAPASAVGGLLFEVAPVAPFFMATAVGMTGALFFASSVEERTPG